MAKLKEKEEEVRGLLSEIGQDHVFRYWPELNRDEKTKLITQLNKICFEDCKEAIEDIFRQSVLTKNIQTPRPPETVDGTGDAIHLQGTEAEQGEKLLSEGKVAAFTVAGGQGTRLGHKGPKGTYPCTPVGRRTLFHHFSESFKFFEKRFGQSPRWFIMTSVDNHQETMEYFSHNNFFGLNQNRVTFFQQGMVPTFDLSGKILLKEKYEIAQSPNGHGGCFRALVESGALNLMEEEGIDCLSYFQVDNPLVYCFDPTFLGFHAAKKSEMSSKVVKKISPDEKVGTFIEEDGALRVLEYSDISLDLATQKDGNGKLSFGMGNIAIHILDRSFVKRIGSRLKAGDQRLPFHGAQKKVSYIDDNGRLAHPQEPNAIKPETFVFDALPLANNPFLYEIDRDEEFAPIKNPDGPDSITTSQELQMKRHKRWLVKRGAKEIPEKVEISPSYSPAYTYFLERFTASERTKFSQATPPLILE